MQFQFCIGCEKNLEELEKILSTMSRKLAVQRYAKLLKKFQVLQPKVSRRCLSEEPRNLSTRLLEKRGLHRRRPLQLASVINEVALTRCWVTIVIKHGR